MLLQPNDLVYVSDTSSDIESTQKIQNKSKIPYRIIQIVKDGVYFVFQSIGRSARKHYLITVHVFQS